MTFLVYMLIGLPSAILAHIRFVKDPNITKGEIWPDKCPLWFIVLFFWVGWLPILIYLVVDILVWLYRR